MHRKKIEQFINIFQVMKTLRFRAIPIGKTLENLIIQGIIEADEEKAKEIKKAQKVMTRYHREFIDRVLTGVELKGLNEYAELFLKNKKTDAEKKQMKALAKGMREQLSGIFTAHPDYNPMFKAAFIDKILPGYTDDPEEQATLAALHGFSGVFSKFNTSKEHLYAKEEKKGTIGYRSINENLPLFLSNTRCFEKIAEALGEDIIATLNRELEVEDYDAAKCFSLGFYNDCLKSRGIEWYNTLIGGRTLEDGTKVKGLNEYINLYNQKIKNQYGKKSGKELPRLKTLYKQLLSEKQSSVFTEIFKGDNEVLDMIRETVGSGTELYKALNELRALFLEFPDYDWNGIFVNNTGSNRDAITGLSGTLLGYWGKIRSVWNDVYDAGKSEKAKKDIDKYEKARDKVFKETQSFSVAELQKLINKALEGSDYEPDAHNYFTKAGHYYTKKPVTKIDETLNAYRRLAPLLAVDYPANKKLAKDDKSIALIKDYLDSLMALQDLLGPLKGSGVEEGRDEVFYGKFLPLLDKFAPIKKLYNSVRNYLTKKPYSKDKFNLRFDRPKFMDGWSKTKLQEDLATLLVKGGEYYLAVLNTKGGYRAFSSLTPNPMGETYQVLDYMQVAGASKQMFNIFVHRNGLDRFGASPEIRRITAEKTYQNNIEDAHKLIDYFKSCIAQYHWSKTYRFSFAETSDYSDIKEFYTDVDETGYALGFYNVSAAELDNLVDTGKLFLFKLWNQDFSKYSKGKEKLHTKYFKALFDPDAGMKLCGQGELFKRKKSIEEGDRVIHPKNQAVKNKNPLNPKKESLFSYDLIKDRRFTEDQFEAHFAVQFNRTGIKAGEAHINDRVRKLLKDDPNPYVIGISRGERNLIYVCVTDSEGRIVEQFPLNIITEQGTGQKVDYRGLLERKEEERQNARKSWKTITGIKDLKKGYMSQVIHRVAQLIEKYDAVVAVEDLSTAFKDSRMKIEKNVYKTFENALIGKLTYLWDKDIAGGESNGFQLCYPESLDNLGLQDGFVFFVQPWYTSNVDPVTGFMSGVYPEYKNMEQARGFIRCFDSIKYHADKNMFCFGTDYSKFEKAKNLYRTKWEIWTNSDRLKYRKDMKTHAWTADRVVLTDEFKKLFDEYSVDYSDGDLREKICSVTAKAFYERFFDLLKLTVQLKNTAPNQTDREHDYVISPVMDKDGRFFDSRTAGGMLPQDASANAAYNIARKALLSIQKIKATGEDEKCSISTTNTEWMEYIQS